MSRPDDPAALAAALPLLVAGALLANAVVAIGMPAMLGPLHLGLGALAAAVLAYGQPGLAVAGWVVVVSLLPEQWLRAVIGLEDSLVIVLLKLSGAGLAALMALRHGLRIPLVHPLYAFLIMFVLSLAIGLHPILTTSDSARTLIGSITPFALAFCVIPPASARLIILAVALGPLINVAFGAVLRIGGFVPFFDIGRLGGTGHPAFLGGLAFTAIMACTLEMLRERRPLWTILAGVNFLILLASAARAPMGLIAMFLVAVFVFVRSRALDAPRKFGLFVFGGLAAALGVVALLMLPGSRLANLGGDASSGRDLMWPIFVAAIEERPWFGGGIGYGRYVLDVNDTLAKLLGTTAAHNEYLRIGADMGLFGLGLVLVMGLLWVLHEGRRVPRVDAIIAAMGMIMFALRSISDNMLIATLALPHFAWIAAVYARGRWEIQVARSTTRAR